VAVAHTATQPQAMTQLSSTLKLLEGSLEAMAEPVDVSSTIRKRTNTELTQLQTTLFELNRTILADFDVMKALLKSKNLPENMAL